MSVFHPPDEPWRPAYTKVCSKCKELKSKASFNKAKKPKDGLCPRCKTCDRAAQKKWREENPETSKLSDRRKLLRHTYGIEIEGWDALFKSQGGLCAICRKGDKGDSTGRRMHVDHDHKTGKVRGLLCGPCNRGLGSFADDMTLLLLAASYLAAYRARS